MPAPRAHANASRPMSIRSALGGLVPECEIASAMIPKPTASKNFNFPQGPLTMPTFKRRGFANLSLGISSSISSVMPTARAMLLAVPIGKIAKGRSTLPMVRATFETVPSPPATTIRSQLPLRADSNSRFLLETQVGVSPAAVSFVIRSRRSG